MWEALEQHWRPRCRAREGASRLSGTLHLAQGQSNRGPGGRKKDFSDAERLVKRLVPADDPEVTDRMWIDAAQSHFRGTVILGTDLLTL